MLKIIYKKNKSQNFAKEWIVTQSMDIKRLIKEITQR